MKHPVKKILSSMFVGCMLISAFTMTAGAVSDVPQINLTNSPSLAGSAFESMKGEIIIIDENGNESSTPYTFTVPVNASESEKASIGTAAARAALGYDASTRAASGEQALITGLHADIPLNTGSSSSSLVAWAQSSLKFTPKEVMMTFMRDRDANFTHLNVALLNKSYSNFECYQMNVSAGAECIVTFVRNRFYDGRDQAFMNSGDKLGMRVSGSGGSGAAQIAMWAIPK